MCILKMSPKALAHERPYIKNIKWGGITKGQHYGPEIIWSLINWWDYLLNPGALYCILS